MKKFILSMFAISLVFVGIAAVVEKAGAAFKSDQKALELISRARQAVGGDAAVANIQSLRILGRTTRAGSDQVGGETEIALLLPDKVMKMVKLGDGANGAMEHHEMNVIVMGEPKGEFKARTDAPLDEAGAHKKIVIKKDGVETVLTDADADKWIAEHPDVPGERRIIIKKDGEAGDQDVLIRRGGEDQVTTTSADGKKFEVRLDHDGAAHNQNELLRLTLGLLLTAPEGLDVEYTSGGTATIDGTNCNVVIANAGGQSFKLFLNASNDLPVAMNYTGVKMPKMELKRPPEANAKGDNVMFVRHKLETAEFQVRFSDYRSVNGVQLPFRWVSSVAGNVDETFDVTSYEINPANIAEKFHQPKQMIRIKKPEIQ